METAPRTAGAGPAIPREILIEIVGYVGAALALTAAGVVLGESAGTGVQVAFDLLTIGVLFAAGWALGAEAEVLLRMKSVFWFLSVFAFTDLAGLFFGDVLDVSGRGLALAVGAAVTGYALALWLLSKRTLQVVALFFAGAAFLLALVFPDVGLGLTPFGFSPPDLTGPSIAVWLYGWAWIGAALVGMIEPRNPSVVLGSIFAIFSPLLLSQSGNDVLGQILALASAAVILAMADRWFERGGAGLAIAGILFASALIVGTNVSEQGPAIVVLAVGLVLLGGAIVAVRSSRGAPAPPPPPPMPE